VSNHHSDANPWILDSGATHHVTTESANLEGYTGNEEVSMGDGKTIPITHTGLTQIKASNSNFMLSNTLCAPAIKKNLISVAKFCTDNLTSIEFFPHSFLVQDLKTQKLLVQGRNKHGLYEWPQRDHVSPSANFTSTKVSRQLWHRRLGHPHLKILDLVLNKFSLPFSTKEKFHFCNSCSSNKAHRLPFQRLTLNSNAPLQTLFSDLWGPSPILSIDKKLYYCIFVDHYTKYIWLYGIKIKEKLLPFSNNLILW